MSVKLKDVIESLDKNGQTYTLKELEKVGFIVTIHDNCEIVFYFDMDGEFLHIRAYD